MQGGAFLCVWDPGSGLAGAIIQAVALEGRSCPLKEQILCCKVMLPSMCAAEVMA